VAAMWWVEAAAEEADAHGCAQSTASHD
jgi:hypothetical protein